jgi:uncharacterized protein (TIGR02147 family)
MKVEQKEPMTDQIALQTKLRTHFLALQRKNPSFSLRAFAQKLQLSPSALSEILNGKRKVSRQLAEKILAQMGTDPQEQSKILSLFQKSSRPDFQDESANDRKYLELKSDQFQMISKWHHFAILSLVETKGFQANLLWIAKRLGIKLPEAEQALERLERMGLIQWSRSQKKIKLTHAQLSTTDDVANPAIRQSHYEDLHLSTQALDQVAVEDRDFSSLTIAIDKSKLPEAKKMIREFQDRLCAFLETGEQDEVYKLNFHVLPLTREVS